MMWLYIISFVALLGLFLFGVATAADDDARRGIIIMVVSAACIVAMGIAAYNSNLEYRQNKCDGWGKQTGYATKFVNIGYGDWDCYAQVDDRWLPTKNVRAFEGEE